MVSNRGSITVSRTWAQPLEHAGIYRWSSVEGLGSHAEIPEQGQAGTVAAVGKALRKGTGQAAIALIVEDDRRWKIEMHGSGVGPCDGSHLFAGIRGGGRFSMTLLRRHDGKMSSLMEKIAWIEQRIEIDAETVADHLNAGKKTRVLDGSKFNIETYLAKEWQDAIENMSAG